MVTSLDLAPQQNKNLKLLPSPIANFRISGERSKPSLNATQFCLLVFVLLIALTPSPHHVSAGDSNHFEKCPLCLQQDMEDDSFLQRPEIALSAGEACRNNSGHTVNLSVQGLLPRSRSPPQ